MEGNGLKAKKDIKIIFTLFKAFVLHETFYSFCYGVLCISSYGPQHACKCRKADFTRNGHDFEEFAI